MDVLTEETIRLSAEATDKVDAIKQCGQLLVAAGYVAPAYVDGMLAREQIASNYLGNGVAIPHGRRQDFDHVYHTGLSVLQLPQGVDWDAGQPVHLVIGLAAVSDENLAVLTNLVDLLQRAEDVQELVQADVPAQIISRLTRA